MDDALREVPDGDRSVFEPMMTSPATIEEILPSTSFLMLILSGTTSATYVAPSRPDSRDSAGVRLSTMAAAAAALINPSAAKVAASLWELLDPLQCPLRAVVDQHSRDPVRRERLGDPPSHVSATDNCDSFFTSRHEVLAFSFNAS